MTEHCSPHLDHVVSLDPQLINPIIMKNNKLACPAIHPTEGNEPAANEPPEFLYRATPFGVLCIIFPIKRLTHHRALDATAGQKSRSLGTVAVVGLRPFKLNESTPPPLFSICPTQPTTKCYMASLAGVARRRLSDCKARISPSAFIRGTPGCLETRPSSFGHKFH